MAEIVINDGNWQEFVPPDGQEHLCGCLPRQSEYGSLEFASPTSAESFPLIPRSEWKDRIAQMERDKSRLSDIMKDGGVPILNQGQLPYCHAFSATLAVMVLRAYQGLPFTLLSAGSVGGPATGYQSRGAAIDSDLRVISTLGVASVEYVPMSQVSRAGWKPGATENALHHRCTEWWDLGGTRKMFDEVMTCLLSAIPVCVGLNWWGHAVAFMDPVIAPSGRFGVRFANSWAETWGDHGFGILEEGKGTPDQAYAPRQITASET